MGRAPCQVSDASVTKIKYHLVRWVYGIRFTIQRPGEVLFPHVILSSHMTPIKLINTTSRLSTLTSYNQLQPCSIPREVLPYHLATHIPPYHPYHRYCYTYTPVWTNSHNFGIGHYLAHRMYGLPLSSLVLEISIKSTWQG